MPLAPADSESLAIQDAQNGRGIFARKLFAPGEIVFEVTGERITCNDEDDLDEKTRSNAFRYDADTYISPAGRIGDFLNHSCEPNAAVVKDGAMLCVVAIAPVSAGEEVVIDYSTIIGCDDSWEMACNCGSANCRRILSEVDSLPADTLRTYRSLNMIPAHILDTCHAEATSHE